jgi:integrase
MKRTNTRRLHHKHGAYYYVATIDGKRVWTRLGKDYGQALREWAALEGRDAQPVDTVAAALGRYLEDSKGTLAEATLRGYAHNAKMLIAVFGKMPLASMERSHVYEYVRRRGNVAGNRERALLSAMFTWAMNNGIHKGANPAAGLRYRNTERPRKRYVEDAELERLIAAAPARWKVLIRFAYITGIGEGDLIRMQLTNARDDGVHFVRHKTGTPQIIQWSDELRALWKAAQGDRIGAQPLFIARRRKQYTESGFRASWRKIKLRAGLDDVTFHDMRRKAGSDLDEVHANKLLAHTTMTTTRRHYRAKIEPVKPVT